MECYRNAMSTGTEGVHTMTRATLLRGFASLALVGCSRRHQEQSNSTVMPLGLAPKVSGSSVPTESDGTSPQFIEVARGAAQGLRVRARQRLGEPDEGLALQPITGDSFAQRIRRIQGAVDHAIHRFLETVVVKSHALGQRAEQIDIRPAFAERFYRLI